MKTIRLSKMDKDTIIKILIAGGILAFPTDTVFGLGCMMDEKAMAKIYKAKGLAYLKRENDQFAGSVNNALSEEEKEMLRKELDLGNGDVLLMIADQKAVANVALGALRKKLGQDLGLIDENKYSFAWITISAGMPG